MPALRINRTSRVSFVRPTVRHRANTRDPCGATEISSRIVPECVRHSRAFLLFDADFLLQQDTLSTTRGGCNEPSNEGLARLHLRFMCRRVLHVRMPVHDSGSSKNAGGMSVRRRVHLRPRLRVRARRKLRLRLRLIWEHHRRMHELVRRWTLTSLRRPAAGVHPPRSTPSSSAKAWRVVR